MKLFSNILKALIGIFIVLNFSHCKKNSEDIFAKAAEAPPIISGVDASSVNGSEESENPTETEEEQDGDVMAFFKNDEGKYEYKFNLKIGETYLLNSSTNITEKQSIGNQSQTIHRNSSEDLEFKVLKEQNGFYKMEATFVNSKETMTDGTKTITISPKQSKPKEEFLQFKWFAQKARLGKKITFQMDQLGNVSNVKGFEKIQNSLKEELKKVLSGEQLKEANMYVMQSLNGNTFKEQVERGIVKLPKTGAAVGESWTEDGASKESKTTLTLDEIKDGKVYISVKNTVPTKSDKQSQQGMTMSVRLDANSFGTIVLDENSGWTSSARITDKVTQVQTISDGTNSQTSKSESTTITTINK